VGTLTDDAYWHASLIAERQGDAKLAVADLHELLASREISQAGQSYERPKYPVAQMRIAELYRDRLNDLRQAREEFRAMYESHRTSSLADDAVWQDGIASLRLGEPAEACRAARLLGERFPDSRYRRCVKSLCPAAEPPKGAHECPGYLQAQLEPNAEQPRSAVADPEARDVD